MPTRLSNLRRVREKHRWETGIGGEKTPSGAESPKVYNAIGIRIVSRNRRRSIKC